MSSKASQVVTAIAQGDAEPVAASLISRLREGFAGREPSFIVLFTSTKQPLEVMAPRVAREFPGATLIGSSTAGEFTEHGDSKSASSIFAVAGDYHVHVGMGTGLAADPEHAVASALAGLPESIPDYPFRTAILLLDPLAGNGEEATLLAAAMLGPGVRLAGGAAGDDLAMKRTVVAAGERVASDAVVIAVLYSRAQLGVGVCHAHQPFSGGHRVTRSAGNVVHEVDGRPAWDVWLEATRAKEKARGVDVDALGEKEIIGYLLRYEAGLAVGEREYKIRAPLARGEGGSIQFACGIPEGSVFRITESDPERQVASAREAARRARAHLGGPDKVAGALVFDCICRNLILEGDFGRAVRGMSEELGGAPLAGFETYGEIALDVGDLSGFHNTTSVVLAFPT